MVGEKRTLIDAEFNSLINLDVIVSDGGGKQDFCRVTISILDENDNPPLFDRDLYEVTFKQIVGEMNILIVFAFDPDQGDNGKIRYARSGNFEFNIDRDSGVITSDSSITSGNYTLIVHAYDNMGRLYWNQQLLYSFRWNRIYRHARFFRTCPTQFQFQKTTRLTHPSSSWKQSQQLPTLRLSTRSTKDGTSEQTRKEHFRSTVSLEKSRSLFIWIMRFYVLVRLNSLSSSKRVISRQTAFTLCSVTVRY